MENKQPTSTRGYHRSIYLNINTFKKIEWLCKEWGTNINRAILNCIEEVHDFMQEEKK